MFFKVSCMWVGERGGNPKSTSKQMHVFFLHSRKLGVDNEGFCKEDI
jgi:hypothetical protein